MAGFRRMLWGSIRYWQDVVCPSGRLIRSFTSAELCRACFGAPELLEVVCFLVEANLILMG